MKKTILTLLAISAASLSFSAAAQFAKPEDAVKYRKAALSVMAEHNKRLGAMAQGKAPFDAKSAAENAEIVASMSKLPWAGLSVTVRMLVRPKPSQKFGNKTPSSKKQQKNFKLNPPN